MHDPEGAQARGAEVRERGGDGGDVGFGEVQNEGDEFVSPRGRPALGWSIWARTSVVYCGGTGEDCVDFEPCEVGAEGCERRTGRRRVVQCQLPRQTDRQTDRQTQRQTDGCVNTSHRQH